MQLKEIFSQNVPHLNLPYSPLEEAKVNHINELQENIGTPIVIKTNHNLDSLTNIDIIQKQTTNNGINTSYPYLNNPDKLISQPNNIENKTNRNESKLLLTLNFNF